MKETNKPIEVQQTQKKVEVNNFFKVSTSNFSEKLNEESNSDSIETKTEQNNSINNSNGKPMKSKQNSQKNNIER